MDEIFLRMDEIWLERLAANAKVATVLGSIPASSDTVAAAAEETVLNNVLT